MKIFDGTTQTIRRDAIGAMAYNFDNVNPMLSIYLKNGDLFWNMAVEDQLDAERLIEEWKEHRQNN